MTETSQKLLFDALTYCDEILSILAGKTYDNYVEDLVLRRAIERDVEIVGEALSQLRNTDPETANLISELRYIVGMRNRLIHGYDTVNDSIVWDTAKNDIPLLRKAVSDLLNKE
jgi:uncharacterized protein with HEPN domain